jgi:hypothetical protein
MKIDCRPDVHHMPENEGDSSSSRAPALQDLSSNPSNWPGGYSSRSRVPA